MTEVRKWKQGDRVTRQVFLDDGTWAKRGDTCLDESPLIHGIVSVRFDRDDEVMVIWDCFGIPGVYSDHELQKELYDNRWNKPGWQQRLKSSGEKKRT